MPDINDKFVIYYAVRGYRTGQTVSIDIYDTVASKEIDTGTMTEMGTTGIYYYNFFPRKRTSYLAVMDCASYPAQTHQVIRVEKQKVSGAVTIPKIVTAFTPKVRDEISSKLLKISNIQSEAGDTIAKLTDIVTKKANDTSVLELSKNMKTLASNVDNTRRESAELMDENVKEINEKNAHAILSSFQGLQSVFLKEVNNLSKSNISQVLKQLTEKVTELSIMADETNANLRLSNDLFSGDIKEKITSLSSQTDELLILLKNAAN